MLICYSCRKPKELPAGNGWSVATDMCEGDQRCFCYISQSGFQVDSLCGFGTLLTWQKCTCGETLNCDCKGINLYPELLWGEINFCTEEAHSLGLVGLNIFVTLTLSLSTLCSHS